MKKLFVIFILCLGCCGILEAQNIWEPLNLPGSLRGVNTQGDLFCIKYAYPLTLQRSQDKGETWETVFTGNIGNCIIGNRGRIFLISDRIVYYSDDNGDTWSQTSPINDGSGYNHFSKEYDFDYVETNGDGYVQTFTVPATGTYRLEVWGAQGGNSPGYSNEGKGGYSVGEITLNKNTNLYIAVGGQGVEIGKGYNGGGIRTDSNWNWFGGSGGGATHIAINNNRGELVNYASNQNEVLIVAGGGRRRIISIRYKKCI